MCEKILPAVEGALLYRALVVVFDSGEDYFWLTIMSAYGAAVTIAGSTLIINIVQSKNYGTDFYFREDACWLEQNYDWAFKGPVLLILVTNTAILALGLYKSYVVSIHNLFFSNIILMYRVAQNHGKQVLRISPIKFHFPIIQFVVIPHGQRDLSSLPWIGGAAVQIS